MKKIAPLTLTLALAAAACTAPYAGTPAPDLAPGAPIDGPCSADNAQDLIGEQATSDLGLRIMQRTAARALRWIQPDQAVTMDYRPDRVNVHLDASNRVERITCG